MMDEARQQALMHTTLNAKERRESSDWVLCMSPSLAVRVPGIATKRQAKSQKRWSGDISATSTPTINSDKSSRHMIKSSVPQLRRPALAARAWSATTTRRKASHARPRYRPVSTVGKNNDAGAFRLAVLCGLPTAVAPVCRRRPTAYLPDTQT